MALTTKCGHCGGAFWEIRTIEPTGANFKQNVLQCSACSVPVGVMDYYNLGSILKKQEKEIADLKKQVAHVAAAVDWIQHAVQTLRR
jgi:hypothetical protein